MFGIFDNDVVFAFTLTLFAGLSTGIGSAIAFFAKRTNTRFLSVSLGFSAGVMIYVSFVEIFPKANENLVADLGQNKGSLITVIAFFAGMLLIAIIDKIVPSAENPHEMYRIEDMKPENCYVRPDGTQVCDLNGQKLEFKPGETAVKIESESSKSLRQSMSEESVDNFGSGGHAHSQKLMRMGVLTALAVAIHNFPEGLATFISALHDRKIAIPIAIAIAIHNIPEGIAVSVPVYFATGSKRKAFRLSFLSGLAEPAGALIGYLILMPFLSDALMGIVFASVAGIMVFISLDELLPSAREYGEPHLSIYGMVAGMVVMAISLLLLS
ncbi:MAG: zinc transporter ZupT [Clostridiaceae bacterium]|nr:zinc transporter ZupT [Clostridiaceae bacterium]